MGPDEETAIVDALYRGACDEGELGRAAGLLAEAFDCPAILLGDVDEISPGKNCLVGAGLMDAEQLRRCGRYAHLDPAPHAFLRLRPGSASTTHRVLDERVWRHGEFYQEFLRPLGIDHAVASPLHADGHRFSIIAVHQVQGRRVLGDDDAARLQRLTPHLARVMHLRRAFVQLAGQRSSMMSIVDRSATGLAGQGRDGAVLFVNGMMRALAAQRDGLSLDRRGLLVLADREASRQTARWHADVLAGGAGGYVRVPRPSRRQPYILSLSRLPMHDEGPSLGGVLFAVVDPARRRVPTEPRIAAVLGLPPGPARVVRALVSGEDLKVYADRAGLSLSTVRSHLKAAFHRTGTHSQSDLVRLTLATLDGLIGEPM